MDATADVSFVRLKQSWLSQLPSRAVSEVGQIGKLQRCTVLRCLTSLLTPEPGQTHFFTIPPRCCEAKGSHWLALSYSPNTTHTPIHHLPSHAHIRLTTAAPLPSHPTPPFRSP